ncbi:MAG: 2-hydroxyglutaryl-CoA dehydratase [Desulfobacterales bacterium]|nr:2-hydroxyglutaryl-CoA dehydratase [Desulfobacterales bacterium]
MIVAGCDIGSLTAKAVILKDDAILSYSVMRAKTKPEESANLVIQDALNKAQIKIEDISFIIGTGYGKEHISFANKVESEIACHAKGAWFNIPSVRTVIDIGGQDAKAIKIDDNGNVIRYIYNDKCASGTGRFLEVMAESLEVKLDEMGEISKKSNNVIKISNQCVIFAETEVVSLVNEGAEIPDIINGIHRAMANRAASIAKSIGIIEDVAFTGGVAKNAGLVFALSHALGLEVKVPLVDPQINGALGAALMAKQHAV